VPQDVSDFKKMFVSDWFDAVGISISTDRHLGTLQTLIPQLKEASDNLNLQVFVGGPMAFCAPDLLKALPAQLVAADAPETVACVTKGMPLSPAGAISNDK
jgi:methylmalonyl-CoA mutase cobalamin-binding subunit